VDLEEEPGVARASRPLWSVECGSLLPLCSCRSLLRGRPQLAAGCFNRVRRGDPEAARLQNRLESGEDGWIVAECLSLPGCVSQGRTEKEAFDNIREAILLWLETEVEKRTVSLPADAKVLEVTI